MIIGTDYPAGRRRLNKTSTQPAADLDKHML